MLNSPIWIFLFLLAKIIICLYSLSTWSRAATGKFAWNVGTFLFGLAVLNFFFPPAYLLREWPSSWRCARENEWLQLLVGITLYLFKYLCPRRSWWAVPDSISGLRLLNILHLNCPFLFKCFKALGKFKKFPEKKSLWIVQGFKVVESGKRLWILTLLQLCLLKIS